MPATARRKRAVHLPAWPGLMLCRLVDEPFDDANWIFEPKIDGLRVLCRFDGQTLSLLSRNRKSQERQFPEIAHALAEALDAPAILDGEIACLDDAGRSSFRLLQQRFHLDDAGQIARRMREYPAVIFVFDLLLAGKDDLRQRPLAERKAMLRSAVRWSNVVRWTEGTPQRGVALLRDACEHGEEGIIAKRLDSPYLDGRSDHWLKIKCIGRQEFVIGGFTEPQGSRLGLGALLVGYFDDEGTFLYAGKVGTGFSDAILRDLRRRLEALERPSSPFTVRGAHKPPPGSSVHWTDPQLVAEIGFQEWTQNGLLRHPRFEGLRMDKKASQVRREKPRSTGRARASASRNATRGGGKSQPRPRVVSRRKTSSGGVEFTHLDRVMFPEKGYTKGDLLQYYAAVADKLLPHLRDRPITLQRDPDGVDRDSPSFWQKNTPTYYPDWIERRKITGADGKVIQYTIVNDANTLLYLVNQGAVTFHITFSRVGSLERPDFVLFDLDPGPRPFADAMTVAKQLRKRLLERKIEPLLKTSGKSGLHVVVPWRQEGGFAEVRTWAMAIAREVEADRPDLATTERAIRKRGGRLYLDIMQNAEGKHAVPPYVIRATPEAGASTPLRWSELKANLKPTTFDLKSAQARFARQKRDLFAPLLEK